jgi:dipeptidyl aminopeptidase/acylaminoacyl peptidase
LQRATEKGNLHAPCGREFPLVEINKEPLPTRARSQTSGKPEQWTDATYADRGEDIRAILKALADSAGIPQRMDLNRLVLAGHSLGGYTVLALAGAWESWKIRGVTAGRVLEQTIPGVSDLRYAP